MRLSRLRLSGFKSFSDPAEIAIDAGLTGIVGPNGCGKSNIVEALRWAMGESSAKGLRGEEMEDVIFNGSGGRPAFDVAEVRLKLLGPVGSLPELADAAEVEIARRLTRGQGSVYRLNGREVRARDVQLLFADAGAGARSASMIGQGQIGFIVESKPQERRRLLEDAAGIGGLHARRRDAESRLAATEANLLRVLDLLREQEARLAELDRQDKQAERYRKVSAELRTAEALHLLARFREAEAAVATARAEDSAARAAVAEAAERAATLRNRRDRQAAALPPQRDEAAGLAARLAALRERRTQLAATAERVRTHHATLTRQRAELEADRAAATEQAAGLAAEIERLGAEADRLAAELAELEPRLPAAAVAEASAAGGLAATEAAQRTAVAEAARSEAALGNAQANLDRARERLAALDRTMADLEAAVARDAASAAGAAPAHAAEQYEQARARLEAAEAALASREEEAGAARRAAEEAGNAAATARDELATAEARARDSQAALSRLREAQAALQRSDARLAEREKAHAARVESNRAATAAVDLPALEATLAAAETALREADALLDAARAVTIDAETVHSQAAAEVREAQRALDGLAAELRLLESLAAELPAGALLGRLRIPEAHARAVAAALAEDLLAAEDEEAPLRWVRLPPLNDAPALPEGATPLADLVEAPDLLARRLAQTGVVSAEAGPGLQEQLQPGQRLVSPDGAVWRWDGLVRAAEAEDAGAARVRHQLRLEAARRESEDAGTAHAAAVAAERARAEALTAGRRDLAAVETAWRQADTAQTSARQRLATGRERLRELEADTAPLASEGEGLRRERAELEQERAGLGDSATAEDAARTAAAERDLLRAESATAEQRRREAATALGAADKAAAEARTAVTGARAALEAARVAQERERAELEAVARARAEAAAERRAKAAALDGERQGLTATLAGLAGEHAAASAAATAARSAVTAAERAFAEARQARETAGRQLAGLREREQRLRSRLAELAAARSTAETRLTEARERAEETAARAERIAAELAALGEPPPPDGDAALAEEIAALETRHEVCLAALRTAEAELASLEAALAEAEAATGTARERLALAQAERARADASLTGAADVVMERLQRPAPALLADEETSAAVAKADPAELEARVARLRTARDRIGPVNLRAGAEAEEVRAALAQTRAEEEELRAAIARLKQATSRLSREGRERLQEVFGVVDGHFRELFVRLFGGGRAQLRLIEGDDPLQAGLELEACPPGKKLASISLLSGGEKTLTALSLVFAFFLANPAPLCVLDEVDAPLDDANVDRFVSLMHDIASATGTRFLVVTHHPLTMTRMDRLYGVTMSERGVSRLVSVALEEAVAMRAAD